MTTDSQAGSLDDPRFQSLLVSCLETLERGEPLDRARLLAEHPEFADELAGFLDDRERLTAMAGGIRDSGEYSDPLAATLTPGDATQVIPQGTRLKYFGDYELLEEIARGGMGVVYKARQSRLKRIVALKMILSGHFASERDVQRFEREARAAAKLRHPNIVAVHEVGEYEDQHYFSMDYVEGQSLAEAIRDEPLPARKAAELLKTIAEAIHAAHEQGTLHRDLKPGNVLPDEKGEPHVTDFGLAKTLDGADGGDDESSELTTSGQILGTPSYMSPEQAEGKHRLVGPASDVYSLGAMLYACLTGRAPFAAESPMDTLMQVIRDEPVPPRMLAPTVPRDLETICLKCLEKRPHERYGTAGLLAEDLERFLEGRAVEARPIGRAAKAWRWCRRNPVVASLLALVFLLMVAGTAISTALAVAEHSQRIVAQNAKNRADEALVETERARGRESEARLEAENERDAAEVARGVAESRGEELRRQLYTAHMPQAQQAWEEGNVSRMKALLRRHKPSDGEEDLRGFEWHYLNQLANSDRLTFDAGVKTYESACDPDGEWIATIGVGRVDVRNLDTGDQIAKFDAEHTTDGRIAAGPLGRLLAGGRYNLRLWDLETRKTVWTIHEQGVIHSIAFTQDGESLVVLRMEWGENRAGVIRVRDAAAGETTLTIRTSDPIAVWAAAVDPSGERIAGNCGDGRVRLWDLRTGELLNEWQGFYTAHAIAFSVDGKQLAYGNFAKELEIRDVKSGEVRARWTDFPTGVESIAFDDLGGRVVVGGASQTVYVVNIATRDVEATYRGHESSLVGVHYRAGRRQVVSTERNGLTKVWDLGRKQGTAELRGTSRGAVTDARFGPHGRWLATSHGIRWDLDQQGEVRLWNIETAEAGPTLDGHTGGVFGVAFQGDGRRLVSAGVDGKAILWDLESFEPVATFESESPLRSVDVARDGLRIAAGAQDGKVCVWNVASGELESTLELRRRTIEAVALSPDGRFVAACDGPGFTVWELPSGREVLADKYQDTSSVAFDHSGKRLAVGSLGLLRLYDVLTWRLDAELAAHNRPIQGVAFHPDGKRFATRSLEGTIKLWDLETLQNLLVLTVRGSRQIERHPPAFSPDGDLLLADNRPDGLQLWSTRGDHSSQHTVVDPDYYRRRGERRALHQRWPEALADFEQAIDADDEAVWARIGAVNAAVMTPDVDRARRHAREAFATAQRLRDVNVTQAGRLVRAACLVPGAVSDFDAAVEIAEATWFKDRRIDEAWARPFALFRAERNEELLAFVDELSRLKDWSVYRSITGHFRAAALYRLGRLEEANAALDKATREFASGMPRIEPGRDFEAKYFDWFVTAVVAHREANQIALAKLNEAVEAEPENVELLAFRGRLHLRWERWSEAARDLRRAAELDPANLEHLEYAALAALNSGETDSYRNLCRQLEAKVTTAPFTDQAWAAARICGLKPGNFDDLDRLIEEVGKQAAKINPRQDGHWSSHIALAALYYRAGRFEEAAAAVQQVRLRRHRDYFEAVTSLWESMVLWQTGDHDGAHRALATAEGLLEERQQPPGVRPVNTFTQIEADVLAREARQLIEEVPLHE